MIHGFTRGSGSDEHVVQLTRGGYESVSEAVVRIVAAYTDRELMELDPLNDSVDPDALNSFAAPALEGSSSGQREVTFDYAGYRITVSTTGYVRLRSTADLN